MDAWNPHVSRLNVIRSEWTPSCSAKSFERIIGAYCEPHRHYHTLRHLDELVSIIESKDSCIEMNEELAWAIWYHDVVYDPDQGDNEERSAEWACRDLNAIGLDRIVINRIDRIIHLTKHGSGESQSLVEIAFLDADLAILGSEPTRYAEYARQIREEYRHIPDHKYTSGRIQVLSTFMNRKSIYRSTPMMSRYEDRARRNIRGEIDRLSLVANSAGK